jgi:hypothetical protein
MGQLLVDILPLRHFPAGSVPSPAEQRLFQQPVRHGFRQRPGDALLSGSFQRFPDGVAGTFKARRYAPVAHPLAVQPEDFSVFGHC